MAETQNIAAMCRRIPLSVNSSMQRPVTPGDSQTVLRTDELPELVLGEQVIFCLSILQNDGAPVPFSGQEVFELAGDRDYDPETGLMLYAGPEQMNLPGDWDEVDPEQGRISLRVNCNTEGFAVKLGAEESVPVILELRMTGLLLFSGRNRRRRSLSDCERRVLRRVAASAQSLISLSVCFYLIPRNRL